jgi:glycosyltransferase involved in cell wall biosynthesis
MKISIVTPCYNSGQHIETTIKSIWTQGYQNFEHIVMDGLSKDNTTDIVKGYPGIKLFSERDSGQSNALNRGFRKTTGDILAWQNADDVYMPGAFEAVANFFASNPETDVVYGDYQLIDNENNWISDVHPIQWNKWLFVHGRFVPLQPTVFWRRRVYEKVGELNEKLHYCMDVDFFSRMVNSGFRFRKMAATLGQFRVHQQSKTQNSDNDDIVWKEYQEVLSGNFNYNFFDFWAFYFFKNRAKLAKTVKNNWLKKL